MVGSLKSTHEDFQGHQFRMNSAEIHMGVAEFAGKKGGSAIPATINPAMHAKRRNGVVEEYIEMDLALAKSSWHRLQRSLDSQEFEFSMSATVRDDLFEPAMEVAPADELFFQGQLLPLQHDPRLHLVQALSTSKEEEDDEGLRGFSLQVDEDGEEGVGVPSLSRPSVGQGVHHVDSGLPSSSCVGHCVNVRGVRQEGLRASGHSNIGEHSDKGMMQGNDVGCHRNLARMVPLEEGSSSSSSSCITAAHEPTDARGVPECAEVGLAPFVGPSVNARSNYRPEGLLLDDSLSSSFGSQKSSFWESGSVHKDSRDSSSSSRCSNGSSQDSCFMNAERRAYEAVSAIAQEGLHCKNKAKRWSWKSLFSGLRKASKIWVDDRSDEHTTSGNAETHDAHRLRRSMFSLKERHSGGKVSAVCAHGATNDTKFSAICAHGAANDAKLGDALGVNRTLSILQSSSKKLTGCQVSPITHKGTEASPNVHRCKGQLGSSIEFCYGREERYPRERPKLALWSQHRVKWQRCLSMVKMKPLITYNDKGKLTPDIREGLKLTSSLSSTDADMKMQGGWLMDHHGINKAKSSCTTPLVKSPLRLGLPCNHAHTPLAASSSSKFNVGFASCPASMRSSPHHSGVLAVVTNKVPQAPTTNFHDLHIAIQDAIAHCKQSQTG